MKAKFKDTLYVDSVFYKKFDELYNSIYTSNMENHFTITGETDPLLTITNDQIKLFNDLVNFKVMEVLYSKASEWPYISWDEYYDDGLPATLNWEMITNNLAQVYTVDLLRERASTGGLDRGQFLTDIILSTPEYKQRKESKQGTIRQDLANTAKANGLDLDRDFSGNVEDWVKRIESGEKADAFKQLIRNNAKLGLPDKVATLLDQGIDLETVFSPYKNAMATTLEINPATISLSDPTLRAAIGPDKEMSLYDFQRALRKDARWQYTNNAREDVFQSVNKVLQDFGFQG
jgi:hypothetical protein